MRVGAPFVPLSFGLESASIPDSQDIIDAVQKSVERSF
jgi:hypothetical protein